MQSFKKGDTVRVGADSPREVDTDGSAYARTGWLVVLLGFLGFLCWSILAPLDKGVLVPGTVAKESNRKAVQHQNGGTVQDILVKDGDVVKAGQVLVRMDPTTVRSAFGMTESQYLSALTVEARLTAEAANTGTIGFPVALRKQQGQAHVAELVRHQEQLLLSRRGALQSELSAIDESVAGLRLQLTGLRASRDSKREQAAILKEQLLDMRELAREGYLARNRLLDHERTHVTLLGQVAEDTGNLGRAERQVAELALRKRQRVQDYQNEVRNALTDVRRDIAVHGARLQAERFELSNVEVKAPVDGIVLGMAVFTRGGVVAPGFRMMEIVPAADALVVEGQLAVNLVDKVHPGLPVELHFSAFNANETPQIAGEVMQVSADRSVDERSGAPYYKIRVRVTSAGVRQIAAHKLAIVPGMPVDLFVKTGERTMMSYLLKPVVERARASLGED